MKLIGPIEILDYGETRLRISQSMGSALGLRDEVTIYGVMLRSEPASPVSTIAQQPRASYIASPYPTSSWANLIRLTVTIPPTKGTLQHLLNTLQELHLYARNVASVNGLYTLSSVLFSDRVASKSLRPEPSALQALPNEHLLIPTAFLVLELPATEPTHTPSTALSREPIYNLATEKEKFSLRDLHLQLRQLLEVPESNRGPVRQRVQAALRQKQPALSSLVVDWISPMSTLNTIGRLWSANLPQTTALRLAREKTTVNWVPDASETYILDLTPWRNLLWDAKTELPEVEPRKPRKPLYLYGFVDSDEGVFCCHFYNSPTNVLIQFEMLVPSAGLEQAWWAWIYTRLASAGGNILASSTSGRLAGQWSVVTSVVEFPFPDETAKNPADDIARILTCFRELQGDAWKTGPFEQFRMSLARITAQVRCDVRGSTGGRQSGEETADNGPMVATRAGSCLRHVRVWSPCDGVRVQKYSARFARNPYEYAKPLNLMMYNQIYDSQQFRGIGFGPGEVRRENTRRGLAERIVTRLVDEERNIAIVGAHRSGKTTLLKLVNDLLEGEPEKRARPIPIVASVTPPTGLLLAVASKIGQDEKGFWPAVRKMFASLWAPMRRFSLEEGTIKRGLFSFKFKRGDPDPARLDDEQLRDFLREAAFVLPSGPANRSAEFLKASLSLLEDVKLSIPIVIIVDELGEMVRWGGEDALAVWRQVLEGESFRAIRWLIATSNPIGQTSPYSPITNAFYEYNIGPLRLEESHLLIDAFDQSDNLPTTQAAEVILSQATDSARVPASTRLYPVITEGARSFILRVTGRLPYFLQIVCWQIYDQATRVYVPIVTKDLCRRITIERTIPELRDFLENEWSRIDADSQKFVIESLRRGNSDPVAWLEDPTPDSADDVPPDLRKILARSGLSGDPPGMVAPLVKFWLLSHGGKVTHGCRL